MGGLRNWRRDTRWRGVPRASRVDGGWHVRRSSGAADRAGQQGSHRAGHTGGYHRRRRARHHHQRVRRATGRGGWRVGECTLAERRKGRGDVSAGGRGARGSGRKARTRRLTRDRCLSEIHRQRAQGTRRRGRSRALRAQRCALSGRRTARGGSRRRWRRRADLLHRALPVGTRRSHLRTRRGVRQPPGARCTHQPVDHARGRRSARDRHPRVDRARMESESGRAVAGERRFSRRLRRARRPR